MTLLVPRHIPSNFPSSFHLMLRGSTLPLTRYSSFIFRPARLSCRLYTNNTSYPSPKALVFSSPGIPSDVLRCVTFSPLKSPPPGGLNIKIIYAPVNPADINVIEGVYPSKPPLLPAAETGLKEDVYVGGNEGLAEVIEVGDEVLDLKPGDWVITTKSQSGTWLWGKTVRQEDVLKIPKVDGLTEVHAATMTVNPPTAYNMLTGFVQLRDGEYVIQNGANSAVGQAVIQIAKHLELKTINFVRSRPQQQLNQLKDHLISLGATHVYTYEDLANKSLNLRAKVREWAGSSGVRLGLNCVGGKETQMMASLLGQNSHLVSYGAMSKQPLTLSTSLLLFKNLMAHGFWQTRWYAEHSKEEREKIMQILVELMASGKLRAPEADIVRLNGSPGEIETRVKTIIKSQAEGKGGRKILFQFAD